MGSFGGARSLQSTGRNIRCIPAFLVLFATHPVTALADFTICNDSFDMLNIAVARNDGTGFVSEGWWTIAPNRCVAVIRERSSSRYVYVHAADVFNNLVLDGATDFCIDEGRFRIAGGDDCWARGHLAAPFAEVDTRQAEDFTLILNASGQLPQN